MQAGRKEIRRRIEAFVKEHWPQQKFVGRLSGYRYCFTRKLESSPTGIPVYLHLVIRHRRRQREIVGFWDAGYFTRHQAGRELPLEVSSKSKVYKYQAGPDGWSRLKKELDGVEIDSLVEKLKDHDAFEIALWQVYKNAQTSAKIPELYESLVRELVAQPGFTMSQPTQLNVADFLKGYVPQEARPEEGQFSLESSRARKKLADFQLTDPQSFVVHLVSGAIAGGTEQVRVYVDSDDIVVEFGGRPLDRGALEQLFSNLLSGRASPQGRELAVALNAASSLDPKSLIVESWRNGQGLILEIDGDGEKLREMDESPPGEGHRIHFRDRPSLKVVRRFLNSLRRDHPEIDLVRKRCARAPVPILVDHGDCRNLDDLKKSFCQLHLKHPDHPLPTLAGSCPVKEDESPVEASILLSIGPQSGLECIVHGVRYDPPEQLDLKGLHALVCDNGATRDLSFTGLVADERWLALREQLESSRDVLLAESARHFERLDNENRLPWAKTLRRISAMGASDFLTLPIFETVDGSLQPRTTLLNHSPILFTGKDWKHGLRSGKPVYKLDREDQNLLWGAGFRNVDKELESSQIYHRHKEKWLMGEPREQICFDNYHGPRLPLVGLEGEVVLGERPGEASFVWTHAQRRPLLPFEDDKLPPGVRVVVNHDGLDVDDQWKNLWRKEPFDEVTRVARAGARDFYQMLLDTESEHTEYLLRFLLFLKSTGENWKKLASRVKFPSRLGDPVALSEILEQTQSEGKPWEELWDGSKRLLKRLAVPLDQLLLVQRLSK